ncbi:MAG: hypothetical protein CSA97_04045 [Bacteroidetes bacterium]|nr:MAG: hypothetical protein CSA97_04045 [Bacteroidota bacterium]
MLMRTNSRLLVLMAFCFPLLASAGELLVPTFSRASHSGEVRPAVKTRSGHASRGKLGLPFFDDFTYAPPQPLESLWEEGGSASTAYGIANYPPTFGTLVLDATDGEGRAYQPTPPDKVLKPSFEADRITSRVIDLSHPTNAPALYQPSDSLYLSFWVQAGGKALAPTPNDSLVLEFYSKAHDKFRTVLRLSYDAQRGTLSQDYSHLKGWPERITARSDTADRHFFRIYVPIRDREYISPDFQFRFRNRATLTIDPNSPANTANASIWLVDRVYIWSNRTCVDGDSPDAGLVDLPEPPLPLYTQVPADAFAELLERRNTEKYDSVVMCYRNFDSRSKTMGLRFYIINAKSSTILWSSNGIHSIAPGEQKRFSRRYKGDRIYGGLSGEIHLRYQNQLDAHDPTVFSVNNNSYRDFLAEDSYAYDLGHSALGYGIVGNGASRAKVALRFDPLRPTTVHSVSIFFNQIAQADKRPSFYLCLWAERDGKPGALIAKQKVEPPLTSDELGKFHEFPLEEPLLLEKPFYVGWQQTADELLNIGFDPTSGLSPQLYYTTSGSWSPSIYQGALMVRIRCGGEDGKRPDTPAPVCSAGTVECTLQPNPASTHVTVRTEARGTASVYSLDGRLLLTGMPLNVPFAIDALRPGVYLLRVIPEGGQAPGAFKLVVR